MHTDKEVLEEVRKKMQHGVRMKPAIAAVIRNEGPSLDEARRSYLWRILTMRVRNNAARQNKEDIVPSPPISPLIDDTLPLDYVSGDDGKHIVVTVDRYRFEYKIMRGVVTYRSFYSTIENEQYLDVSSEIRFQARDAAQFYFLRLPDWRKKLLSR